MEKVIHKISEKISAHMMYDEEKRAVIEYGLLAVTNIMIIAVAVLVIGIIFHVLAESIVIFLGVGILKKSTGGAHSKSMMGCVIISVVSITLFALLSRYVLGLYIGKYLNIGISIAIFVISFFIFYKFVPVDTPNKPIKNPKKIKRLRAQSFSILMIYTIISLILSYFVSQDERFYSLIPCIHFVLLWQTFMITKKGMAFIECIDPKFV